MLKKTLLKAFQKMPDKPRPEPHVVRVAREFRLALMAREDAQLQRMAKIYLDIERRLESDIYALVLEVEKIRNAGGIIDVFHIRRMEKFKSLQRQIKIELSRFVDKVALPDIKLEQLAFGEWGVNGSVAAIRASYKIGLGEVFDILPRSAIMAYVGTAGDGSPLKTLLDEAYPQVIDEVVNGLINGMARGINPVQIARDLSKSLDIGLDRITLIARTEQLRAYRISSVAQYRESGVVTGFRRLAAKDERTCLACLALDGTIYKVESEMTDHPRGRCTTVPIVIGAPIPAWQFGPQWFETLPEGTQRTMMGGEKFDLWQAGAFKFEDLAGWSRSDVWGDSPRVKTIKELTE
jgi:SPP1 gp7 family putative phage head morphogenesis protein